MKILIVTPYFFPKIGGLENYSLNIAKGLQRQGHQIIIVTSNHETKDRVEIRVQGLRVIRLPYTFKISNTPLSFSWKRQLKEIIMKESPDVINAHTPVPFIADMAERVSGRTPYILTYHNDLVKKSLTGSVLAKIYYFVFLRKTLQGSDSIIATSMSYVDKSHYLHKYQNKIEIVSPGVDKKRFNTKVDKQWLKKKYHDKKIVLFVGSLQNSNKHKGMDVLLRAIAELKKEIRNVQLVAVGAGDAIPKYVRLANKLGVAESVDFTGFVDDDLLPRYYAGSDVCVLPSTTEAEGFGMSLLEAMACGTFVIGTSVGGISSFVKNNFQGQIIEPNNVTQLSRALVHKLTPNKSSKKAGFNKFKQELDNWSISSEKYIQAIERICLPQIVNVIAHYPPYIGGMELRTKELATKLSIKKRRVVVFASDQHTTAHKEKINSYLEVEYLPSFEIANTAVIFGLVQRMRHISKNSVVHIHVAQALLPELTALICKIRQIPYVVQMHLDVQPSTFTGKLVLRPYKYFFLSSVIRNASRIVVLTPDYIDLIVDKYKVDKDKLVVIPNGTDFEIVKQAKSLDKFTKKILYVGRLSKQKDIPLLINGIKAYKERYGSDISVDIVGGGTLEKKLKDLVERKRLSNMVSFYDPIIGKKLERKYQHADLFILTSSYESFGSVIIEAMTKALPIIATNIIAVRTLVNDKENGLLVDSNPLAISNAINTILQNKDLYEQMSKSSLKLAKNYSWNQVIKQFEDLYDKVYEE